MWAVRDVYGWGERLEGVAEHEELELGVHAGAMMGAGDPGARGVDGAILI